MERRGHKKEERRGRGGDCAPIHTGGIWLENEFLFFFSVLGWRSFPQEGWSETEPGDQERVRVSAGGADLELRGWRRKEEQGSDAGSKLG